MRLYPDLNQLSAGERVQQRVKRMGGDVRQLVEQLWAEVEDMERTRMQTRAARAAGTGGGRSGEASSGVVSSGGGAGSSAVTSPVTYAVSSSDARTVTRPAKPKRPAPPLVAPPGHPARAAAQSLAAPPGGTSQTDKSTRPAAVPVVIRAVRPSQMYGEAGVKDTLPPEFRGVGAIIEPGVKVKAKVQEREEVLPSLQRPAGSGRFDNAAEASKVSSDKGVQGEAMGGKAKKAKKGKKGNKGKEEREEVMPVLQRPAGSVHAVEASSTVVVEKGVEGERPAEKKKDEREVVLPALQRPVGGSGGAVSADEASRVPVKGTTGETMDGKTREMAKEEEREQVLPALQRPVGGSGEAPGTISNPQAVTPIPKGLPPVVTPPPVDLRRTHPDFFRPPFPPKPCSFHHSRPSKPGTTSNPQAVTPIPKGLPPVVTPPPVDLPVSQSLTPVLSPTAGLPSL
ncbi:unnamed protein product [Closterium sp. NIES-65]|nr:unnamed protein product [Closterium sp. NIES-65]